ncbi:hypothetical protein CR513_06211, partial [Mucuna pruriens]
MYFSIDAWRKRCILLSHQVLTSMVSRKRCIRCLVEHRVYVKFLHGRLYIFSKEVAIQQQHMLKMNVKLESSDEEVVDDTLFKQSIGSLRYPSNSRPDICYRVGLISKFMDDPKKPHLVVAKRIMWNLQGTLEYGVLFTKKM